MCEPGHDIERLIGTGQSGRRCRLHHPATRRPEAKMSRTAAWPVDSAVAAFPITAAPPRIRGTLAPGAGPAR